LLGCFFFGLGFRGHRAEVLHRGVGIDLADGADLRFPLALVLILAEAGFFFHFPFAFEFFFEFRQDFGLELGTISG
jgi:hypothetical protein